MTLANTPTHYGSVARTLHWLTALVILTAIPLGVIANGIPIEEDTVARKTLLFSLHKTVGVAAFFVGLARILWALTQPRPVPLHPDRRIETSTAETVHWMLYIALIVVPLSGWLHHAATTGFAPIWWPFGQSLPFVPVDFRVAEFFSALHWLFTKVLLVAVLLHVAGALKHVLVDRDGTLARMTTGHCEVEAAEAPHQSRWPPFVAAGIWLAALLTGSLLGLSGEDRGEAAQLDPPVASEWLVEGGTLGITITQLGSEVQGGFNDWVASIRFDENAPGDMLGDVIVDIVIASLQLGTVTDQALGPDFFDTTVFPVASFAGPIVEAPLGDGYQVDGVLTIRDTAIPVTLPFELTFSGDQVLARGKMTLDRRDFGIGKAYQDESTLGFSVTVTIDLNATRLEF